MCDVIDSLGYVHILCVICVGCLHCSVLSAATCCGGVLVSGGVAVRVGDIVAVSCHLLCIGK